MLRIKQLSPDMWVLTIQLPYRSTPAIMRSNSLTGYAKAGALVGLDFWTHGVNTQQYDLQTLIEKYGQPSTRSGTSVQNRMGATFDSIVATWTLPDGLVVVFRGIGARLDEGMVQVSLPAAAEVRAAQAAAVDKVLNPKKL